mgnify:CR=1 FL=1
MSESGKCEKALKELASLAKWSAVCSKAEIKGLDSYLREKVHDLVKKFQLIAENATLYAQIAKEAEKSGEEKKRIKIKDKEYTVSEATKELHRLTDALLDDGTESHHKIDLRKNIDNISLALFKFTKDLESKSSETSQYIQIITQNIKDIIVAFQFHDFVTQRLEHIEMVFNALERKADDVFKTHLNGADQKVPDNLANDLLGAFFLSDVKNTFSKGLDPSQAANLNVKHDTAEADITEGQGDVELF